MEAETELSAELLWDAFDHTPTTRRLNTGKAIASTGADRVGFLEDKLASGNMMLPGWRMGI